MFEINENEVRKTIAILKPNGELFEVRFISGKWNCSGYFTSVDTFLEKLEGLQYRIPDGANAYLLLNPPTQACYSRAQRDKLLTSPEKTTGDNDVQRLKWIMVDIDPKRASGTSSSDAELESARLISKQIIVFLRGRGFAEPIVAMSGNGYHLLYSVDMDNIAENKTLVENFIKALNMLFSNSVCDIDLKTFNPARICKLYGSMAQKGANTEDRPHRMSRIVYVPNSITDVPKTQISDLCESVLPKQDHPQQYNSYNPQRFSLKDWLDSHSVNYVGTEPWNGGTKYILECCPFDPSHKGKDASVVQTADGKICFNCFHASCADKRWRDFRLLYEPDAYSQEHQTAIPNYKVPKSVYAQRIENASLPVWVTTEQIRTKPVPEAEYIRTGIQGIDSRMMGLKKGCCTVLSGLRSSGKSSILSQLVLNARNDGYRVALFSGEMADKTILRWLALQGAGKWNTRLAYGNIFYVPKDGVEEKISRWMDGFLYVYNNDYGNKFSAILDSIKQVVEEKLVDLVCIDNLMALDIEDLDPDKYSRQTKFVCALENLAKQMNVHVLFVAHPRKSTGYLRTDDISGSGDLSNRADNVFIIHRVDEDYKRLTKEMFGWPASKDLYAADNVIEICKDRDLGYRDVHIPLWFEPETKRLKNSQSEAIHYDWEIENESPLTREEEDDEDDLSEFVEVVDPNSPF